jgi:hypothetical protein
MLIRSMTGPAARHGGAQLRDPLRRLPIGHARVGEASEREDRGIGPRRDVLVGRIGQDRPERRLVLARIAPFRPFGRRERQVAVEHRVEDVDEGHLGDDRCEEVVAAMLATAPISMPPAEPPSATRRFRPV